MKHAKTARLFDYIAAVKNDSRCFQHVNVYLQSTSSCNIESVNTFNECAKFVELREKGRGKNKRQWVIEMNHNPRIYSSTYLWIDVLDNRIKKSHIFYIVWEYWNHSMNDRLSTKIDSE